MNKIWNSSPLELTNNSFLDSTPSMNERTHDEMSKSNKSFFYNNSAAFGQKRESPCTQINEDSNIIFWPESDNTLIDISEDSFPFSEQVYDKNSNEKLSKSIRKSYSNIEENIENKSLSFIPNVNESNDLDYFNMPKMFEDEEKSSELSGDSFLSCLEIYPNLDGINSEIIKNNELYLIDERKDESLKINVKEPIENSHNINKDKKNKENVLNNNLIEEKKKTKINFFVSKKENNNLINIEKNNKSFDDPKNTEILKNEYIGRKREKENNILAQITKNGIKSVKINNLHEINKVTIISPKAYKCECGKIFSTEENQRLHYINIHLHEKPYNCSFCGEGFSHRNGKIYHERVYHTFIFPYPCKDCSCAFASKSALIYHMKSKHKVNNSFINKNI